MYEPAPGAVTPPVSRGTDTIRRPPPAEKAAGWSSDLSDTDDSLHILPPQSDMPPADAPNADLKWHVSEATPQPPQSDDEDLERFLKDLGEKPE
jgi:hypothetical protein